MRLQVAAVFQASGGFEAYPYTGDDGFPTAAVFNPICVRTQDGREFYLPMGERKVCREDGTTFYKARYAVTDRLMDRIREEGIDPDYWVEVHPLDLEALWEIEAERERSEDRQFA